MGCAVCYRNSSEQLPLFATPSVPSLLRCPSCDQNMLRHRFSDICLSDMCCYRVPPTTLHKERTMTFHYSYHRHVNSLPAYQKCRHGWPVSQCVVCQQPEQEEEILSTEPEDSRQLSLFPDYQERSTSSHRR